MVPNWPLSRAASGGHPRSARRAPRSRDRSAVPWASCTSRWWASSWWRSPGRSAGSPRTSSRGGAGRRPSSPRLWMEIGGLNNYICARFITRLCLFFPAHWEDLLWAEQNKLNLGHNGMTYLVDILLWGLALGACNNWLNQCFLIHKVFFFLFSDSVNNFVISYCNKL